MKRINIDILGLTVGVALLGACTQLQNPPKASKISNMVVGTPDCSTEKLSLPDGYQGMAMIQLMENYTTGKPQVMGKAFFLSKPATGVNPYAVIGEGGDRSQADRKAIAGLKGSLVSVGNRIDITLNGAPENPGLASMAQGKKADEVLTIQRNAMTSAGVTTGIQTISLLQWANHPAGFYNTDYTMPLENPSAAGAANAGTGTQFSNVRSYRSFVVDAKANNAFTVAIPKSPEGTDATGDTILKAAAGDPIKLTIAGDPDAPASVEKRLLIIQMQDRSDNPKWQSTCVMKDVGADGGEISIPTAWGDKPKQTTLASGDFYFRLFRSYVRKADLPPAGGDASAPAGFIYVDSRSGFQTQGTLK